jgi:anthranilate phosphoribosyltransferase
VLKSLTEQLLALTPLSGEQVGFALEQLLDEDLTAEVKAGFLTALAQKGETVIEVTAFARALRARAIQPLLEPKTRSQEILDVCGTGGDRLNTFNISTTVALIAAAAGITVAKHGNRAITSQAGSADVLEALGIRIDLTPEEAVRSLREHQFAFFFAPRYHPTFKHITAARKLCANRGQRTIFNFLGPLLNPVQPTAQLLGVSRPDLCAPMAQALQSLGVRRGMVVCGGVESKVQSPHFKVEASTRLLHAGADGAASAAVSFLDELSTLGENTIAEFYHDKGFASSVLPPGLPIQPAVLADLKGGDRATNALIVRRILQGTERGPMRDAVLLNAGAALFVAGRTRTIADGWALAGELIDGGQAQRKLAELIDAFPVAL